MVAGRRERGVTSKIAYAVFDENEGTMYFFADENIELDEVTIGGKTIQLYDTHNSWRGDYVTDTQNNAPDWNKINKDVTKVVFFESFKDVTPLSCHKWFEGFTILTEIEGIEYLNTSKVTDMLEMFNGCNSLSVLDLRTFDTSNVTTMYEMFLNCNSLSSLNLSGLNTSKVSNMDWMFKNCKQLKILDLSNFITSNVTSARAMFTGCSSLTELDLSGSSTEKIPNMGSMFLNCSSLMSLDLSGFKTAAVTSMEEMFHSCKNLSTLDFGNLDTSALTELTNMFGTWGYYANLDFVDLSNAKGNKVSEVANLTRYAATVYVPVGTEGITKTNVFYCDEDGDIVLDELEIDGSNKENLSIPRNFTASNITINRSFKQGEPHTLYLPFAMDAHKYGDFYTFNKYSGDKVTFSKVEAEKTEPNTPYLFIPSEGYEKIEIVETTQGLATPAATEPADNYAGLVGVYNKKEFSTEEVAAMIYYGWANNKFLRAGNGASVSACRAYLKLPAAASGAPASLSISLDGDDTTAIADIINAGNNGNAPAYNLQGQCVGNSYKGVVIRNGKKMIFR